jgi:Group II intron, maturase-specific domain/Reverse transcriptase (RNA-dependent DNA polymerase)
MRWVRGTTSSYAWATQAGLSRLGSNMTLTSSVLVVFGSRRAMTASSLPLRWDVVRLHHRERCAQKPNPIAGSKLLTRDACRELYDIFGNFVGSVRSPLLANLLLDGLDKELERRGHRFVRYADDSNIFVKSARAGQRVLASVTRFLGRHLKLTVNAAKSAVDRPWRRTFLGFTFTGHRPNRRRVSVKALEACKREVRQLTSRTRGVSLRRVAGDLRRYLDGWYAYFGFTEAPSSFKELDSWIRRRLRCYLWQQWGRRRYRELRRRGVSRDLAWNTVKSAHGPWRVSHSPALAIALPGSSFDGLGVPRLHRSSRR